jgi:K+-sensing histidine kinase KdpD
MEKLYRLVQFYKNLKTNLSLSDQLKQLCDIFPLIWDHDPLFFYDLDRGKCQELNPTFTGEKLPIQFDDPCFDLTTPNFPLSCKWNGYLIFYVYIDIQTRSRGILFTYTHPGNEHNAILENKFSKLSLLLIQNSMKNSYYQFNRISRFIIDLNHICLSSFDLRVVINNLLSLLNRNFPDLQHELYYKTQNNWIEFKVHNSKLSETVVLNKVKKDELQAFLKIDTGPFIEKNNQTMIVKLADKEKNYGLLYIHAPYYHFWNEEIQVYYEILTGALVQTFSRIHLFQQIESERQELESLIQFKKDITSMIVHDLSSPLMGIMGYLGIIRATNQDISPKLLDYIDKSYRLTIRLNKLIEDFRLINHLDTNRLHLKFFPVEMNTFIENIIKFYQDLFPCTIHFEHPNYELFAEIDPDYFSRVIENLINNSIKYVGEDVEIRIHMWDEESWIILDISDNGPGIPDDEIHKIFDKYKRGKNVKKITGSGLGLYICKIVTDMHHGKIMGQNHSDGKTHFIIKIPRMTDETNFLS